MCPRVDPKKRVLPVVGELYVDRMVADRTAGASRFEYGFGAPAAAAHIFQN